MSEHHDHSHQPPWKGGARYFIAAVSLSFFAIFEVYLGVSVLHSPIVVADAGHNLSDVVFAAASGIIAIIALAGRNNHFVSQHMQHYASIVISLATILVIGIAVFREALEPIPSQWSVLLLTAILGLMSYGVNILLALYLRRGTNSLARSTAQHFESDAKVSLILVPTAILAGILNATVGSGLSTSVILLGSVLVLLKTAQDNLSQARATVRELNDCRASDRDNPQ